MTIAPDLVALQEMTNRIAEQLEQLSRRTDVTTDQREALRIARAIALTLQDELAEVTIPHPLRTDSLGLFSPLEVKVP